MTLPTRRALVVLAGAALQTLVLSGGLALALDLERTVLTDLEPLGRVAPRARFQGGGMTLDLRMMSCGSTRPPFELALALVPFLLSLLRDHPPPLTLRLRA